MAKYINIDLLESKAAINENNKHYLVDIVTCAECTECKQVHSDEILFKCDLFHHIVYPEGFCYWGAKKGDAL